LSLSDRKDIQDTLKDIEILGYFKHIKRKGMWHKLRDRISCKVEVFFFLKKYIALNNPNVVWVGSTEAASLLKAIVNCSSETGHA